MRSNLMKFLAIVLAAALLTVAALSGFAIIYLVDQGLYTKTPGQENMDFMEEMTYRVAYNYALEQISVSEGLTPEEHQLLQYMYTPYCIKSKVLEIYPSSASPTYTAGVTSFTHTIDGLLYPVALEEGEEMPDTDALPVYTDIEMLYTEKGWQEYTLLYYQAAPMVVGVTMSNKLSPELELTEYIYNLRDLLAVTAVGSVVLALVCLVYLCWAAGKKKGQDDIRPGGLNRLPLDLYTAAILLALYLCAIVLVEEVLSGINAMYFGLTALAAAGLCFAMGVLVISWIIAFAAQVKAKGFWWRKSVIGWCLINIFRGIRWCWRCAQAVLRLLPVIWQWLLTAFGMVIVPALLLLFSSASWGFSRSFWRLMFIGSLITNAAIVLYGGYCFGTILKSAKEMATGNPNHKVNTTNLVAAFRDCGENLNRLSNSAMEAAQQQMKSERMKTELIANVSHDIKTPLTSIINYVDLLQKPHSEEEKREYLEVLSRQSQRLKKLTEDLVEMSKATTGNITPELMQVDACEAVHQALGEFSDKLEAAHLNVVLRLPEEPVMMQADGRLTWRVMSNLLSNAVKYAMPNTRLYVDVEQQNAHVLISLKNMSREELNITADELMERFVRGDASRHTEGSGLGLSIAKGLMEAQNGSLELLTDGDLFKVTLVFPVDDHA